MYNHSVGSRVTSDHTPTVTMGHRAHPRPETYHSGDGTPPDQERSPHPWVGRGVTRGTRPVTTYVRQVHPD